MTHSSELGEILSKDQRLYFNGLIPHAISKDNLKVSCCIAVYIADIDNNVSHVGFSLQIDYLLYSGHVKVDHNLEMWVPCAMLVATRPPPSLHKCHKLTLSKATSDMLMRLLPLGREYTFGSSNPLQLSTFQKVCFNINPLLLELSTTLDMLIQSLPSEGFGALAILYSMTNNY
jgi:hypothetical protein